MKAAPPTGAGEAYTRDGCHRPKVLTKANTTRQPHGYTQNRGTGDAPMIQGLGK